MYSEYAKREMDRRFVLYEDAKPISETRDEGQKDFLVDMYTRERRVIVVKVLTGNQKS